MIYETVPKDFNPRFEIVSCFVEYDGRVILLHRHEHKSQGGRWGLPAGKVEPGEDAKKALAREIKEETSLEIPEEKLNYFGKTFHHHGDYDFVFHMFSTKLDSLPEVVINSYEHKAFAWKTPSELFAMKKEEIIEDFDDTCRLFYNVP